MKISVVSVEVATLKTSGHHWDGPGGPRVAPRNLSNFFRKDLDAQLGHLVETGPAPVPPDLFVRLFVDNEQVVETRDQKGFDAEWTEDDGVAEVQPGAPLVIEVWDRDLMFDDLVGRIDVQVPASPASAELVEGRWEITSFGQVRKLVLRLA